jgi:hypothetical protein
MVLDKVGQVNEDRLNEKLDQYKEKLRRANGEY